MVRAGAGLTARQWCGLALVVAGVAFGLGLFFVPPHVLIPELIRAPRIGVFEGLVGLWLAAVGGALLVTGRRRRPQPDRRSDPGDRP